MSLSTTTNSELLRPLTDKFHTLRGRLRQWVLVDGLRRFLLCLLSILVLDFSVDWLFAMDRPQRGVVLLLAVLLLAALVVRRLILPLCQQPSEDALCLRVQKDQGLGDVLINAVQLGRLQDPAPSGFSPSLIQATIRRGLAAAAGVSFDDVLDKQVYRRNLRIISGAAAALVGLALAVLLTDTMSIWFARNVLLADRDWPQDTYLTISSAQEGRMRVPQGADWPVTVEIDPSSRRIPDEVVLEIAADQQLRQETLRPSVDPQRFVTILKKITRPMRVRAVAGRAATVWVDVVPVAYPAATGLQLEIEPPQYTGQAGYRLSADKPQAPILAGSRLRLSGQSSKPLAAARLVKLTPPGAPPAVTARIIAPENLLFRAELLLTQDAAGSYAIELADTEQIVRPGTEEPENLVNREAARFAIRVQTDQAPRIKLRRGMIGSRIAPTARIPFTSEIQERYGLSDIRVVQQWLVPAAANDASQEPHRQVESKSELAGTLRDGKLTFTDTVDLADADLQVGTHVELRVAATDNNDVSGPSTGQSAPLRFRVVARDELRTELLQRERVFREVIIEQQKRQIALLADTQNLLRGLDRGTAFERPQLVALARIQKTQKQLAGNLISTRQGLEQILAEIENNRLEPAGGTHQQRLDHLVIAPLAELAADAVPAAVRDLDAARRGMAEPQSLADALAGAVARQGDIDRRLRGVIRNMVEDVNFQLVLDLLREITGSQEEILKESDQQRQRLIQQFLEKEGGGNSPPSDND